ncbi:electron transport complex subunit RsxC [Gammaproteobacteria bacterium 42_54_T18]|nr:electron transport complex subunit RsxC [Gammaproteobacteria bacterium 42_54_T18]
MSRRIWDIPGGIHPAENKQQSLQTHIITAHIPAELVVPVQQHIGAPGKPCVEVGDKVLKGQMIAEANGFVSLPTHAPTSGEIIAIESRPVQHPSQIDGLCIIIKADNLDQWIDHNAINEYQSKERSDIINTIRQAGISGMGGAGFPSTIKLGIRPDTKIEQLILNSAECEPYITADDSLIQERADEVVAGLKIMQWLVKPQETLIGIEDNKPNAIAALKQATADSDIEVVVVPTKYPSGGEKQIIYLLTGKEVASGGLPSDVGVICQNTGTAYAVNRAIHFGEPLISRITTVTGDAIKNKGNYEVLLGTPVDALLSQAGAKFDQTSRLIMGGPMMGFSIHNSAVPIVKVTNCLLAPTEKEIPEPDAEQPCIRCGNCTQVCPAGLLPQQLYWFSKSNELEKAKHFNLADCIECGACSFVCPSNIPLVQYFRFGKGQIRKQEAETAKADQARERFEFRQARLEKEDREKEEKRKARAEAAAKKQAAKKAAAAENPATSESGPTIPTGSESTADASAVTKLKATWSSTTKRWKDAEKALKVAEKNGNEHIDALKKKVEQLKVKADKAKSLYDEAKVADAANISNVNGPTATKQTNKQAATQPTNDPMQKLKQASTDDFNAWKAAQQKTQDAEANSSDGADIESLRKTEAEAKEKSAASKAAMKEARAKEKEAMQAKKSAEDPAKQLKLDAAITRTKAKKALKALDSLTEDHASYDALKTAYEKAQTAAESAELALKAAEEA